MLGLGPGLQVVPLLHNLDDGLFHRNTECAANCGVLWFIKFFKFGRSSYYDYDDYYHDYYYYYLTWRAVFLMLESNAWLQMVDLLFNAIGPIGPCLEGAPNDSTLKHWSIDIRCRSGSAFSDMLFREPICEKLGLVPRFGLEWNWMKTIYIGILTFIGFSLPQMCCFSWTTRFLSKYFPKQVSLGCHRSFNQIGPQSRGAAQGARHTTIGCSKSKSIWKWMSWGETLPWKSDDPRVFWMNL